jgi:vacuolar-type H+-ATPase subunit E/Vma4
VTEEELGRFLERIRADSIHSANTIIEEARRKVAQRIEESIKQGREDAFKQREDMLRDARTKSMALRNRVLSEARLKANAIRLNAVNRALESILHDVLEELIEWSKNDRIGYMELLKNLIIEGIETIREDVELILKEEDLKLNLDLTSLSREVADKIGVNVKVTFSKEKLDAAGGVVIRSVDGRIVVHNTFEAIIERFKRRLHSRILKMLLEK